MPKRFTTTENAIEKDPSNITPAAGLKLVGDWMSELSKLDAANAKGLHDDLIQLEKELKGDSPDSARVRSC